MPASWTCRRRVPRASKSIRFCLAAALPLPGMVAGGRPRCSRARWRSKGTAPGMSSVTRTLLHTSPKRPSSFRSRTGGAAPGPGEAQVGAEEELDALSRNNTLKGVDQFRERRHPAAGGHRLREPGGVEVDHVERAAAVPPLPREEEVRGMEVRRID